MGEKRKSSVVVMKRELINSKAYLALTGVSPQLLLLFYARRKMAHVGRKGKKKWTCTNASEIEFTYAEAKKRFGITNSRFTRGIDVLIEKGFIDIAHHGGCYQHDKTIYSISDRWKKYGNPDYETCKRQIDPVQRGYRKPKKIATTNGCLYTNETDVLTESLGHINDDTSKR